VGQPDDPRRRGRSGDSAPGSTGGEDSGTQPGYGPAQSGWPDYGPAGQADQPGYGPAPSGWQDQGPAGQADQPRYGPAPSGWQDQGPAGHADQPRYGDQSGYGDQPGYGPPAGYGDQPGYGQAGYTQPGYGLGAYGSSPYGHPPYGQPTYGGYSGAGYGGYGAVPGYGGPYGPYGQRPSGATVITAAVIQIVQASLFILLGLLLIFVADALDRGLRDLGSETGVDTAPGAVTAAAIGIGLAIVLFAAFMIVLAALAMRRFRWAMITSVVIQCIAVVLGIGGLAQSSDRPGGNVIFIAASIAVIVLFLIPPSTRYFAYREA
jgi:hypothetical protein